VRFARLIHRRVRAFWQAFGLRRLRRQSQPALVATQGGMADRSGAYPASLSTDELTAGQGSPSWVNGL
jgi:hypothetical protein